MESKSIIPYVNNAQTVAKGDRSTRVPSSDDSDVKAGVQAVPRTEHKTLVAIRTLASTDCDEFDKKQHGNSAAASLSTPTTPTSPSGLKCTICSDDRIFSSSGYLQMHHDYRHSKKKKKKREDIRPPPPLKRLRPVRQIFQGDNTVKAAEVAEGAVDIKEGLLEEEPMEEHGAEAQDWTC